MMSDFLLNFKRFKAKAANKTPRKSHMASSSRLKKRVVEFADTSSSCGLSSDTEQRDSANEISVTKNNIMVKENDGQACEAIS